MKYPIALRFAAIAALAAAWAKAADSAAVPGCPPSAAPPAGGARAKTDGARPACCAAAKAEVAAPAPCCAGSTPARPLSVRSLFQLEAQWTDDTGQSVSLASLRGRPVVLAMFFASCEYACPVLVDDLKRLRAATTEEARRKTPVVLVSFDPVRDTPAALRAFRERMNLDQHWILLHGENSPVQELAMLLGVKYKQDARGQFAHSNLFTVLNAEGEIAHQQAGLMGDVAEAAKLLARLDR